VKKVVPAVFFQKHLDGANVVVKKPERLELYESELRAVSGGRFAVGDSFSYSAGWADVEQPDDCQG
jgi:hypothetical protein